MMLYGAPATAAVAGAPELASVTPVTLSPFANPLAANNPWLDCNIDWEASMRYRRHLWTLGLALLVLTAFQDNIVFFFSPTEVAQRHGNLVGRTARPLQAGDGVASGVVFEQELDQRDDVGVFFSTGLRPPPTRRVRSVDTV